MKDRKIDKKGRGMSGDLEVSGTQRVYDMQTTATRASADTFLFFFTSEAFLRLTSTLTIFTAMLP